MPSNGAQSNSRSRATILALLLISITVLLSLLYAFQHFAGGPIGLAVVSGVQDLALSPDNTLVAAGANDGDI